MSHRMECQCVIIFRIIVAEKSKAHAQAWTSIPRFLVTYLSPPPLPDEISNNSGR